MFEETNKRFSTDEIEEAVRLLEQFGIVETRVENGELQFRATERGVREAPILKDMLIQQWLEDIDDRLKRIEDALFGGMKR